LRLRQIGSIDFAPSHQFTSIASSIKLEGRTMMRLLALVSLLAVQCSAFAPASHLQQTQSTRAPLVNYDHTSMGRTAIPPYSFSSSSTSLQLKVLERTELPEKLYFPQEKEAPKVLGGLKVGLRKMVCITGASSGLGLAASIALAKTGKYFIIMACRNIEKAKEGMFNMDFIRSFVHLTHFFPLPCLIVFILKYAYEHLLPRPICRTAVT
jgi:hypothetical protein